MHTVNVDIDVNDQWHAFVDQQRADELDRIIEQDQLDPDAARSFMASAFRDGAIESGGTAITQLLPPVSKFAPEGQHAAQKNAVLAHLATFFDRYADLV